MLTACFRAPTLLRGWGEEFGRGFEDQWPECCRKSEEMILMVQIGLRRFFFFKCIWMISSSYSQHSYSFIQEHLPHPGLTTKGQVDFFLIHPGWVQREGKHANGFWGRTAADSVPRDLSVTSLLCRSCFFRLHWPRVTWSKKEAVTSLVAGKKQPNLISCE